MDYIQYTQTKCIHMHISYICVNYLLWGWVRLLVRAQTSQISNQIGTSYTICGIKKTYSDLFGIVSRNHVVVISLPKTDLAHKKKPWKKKSSLPLRVGFWTYRNTIGYNPYNNFSARVAFTCLDSSDLSRFNNPNPNLQKIIFPHSDARFLPMISLRPEISHSPVGSQSARHNSVVAKSFPPWKKKSGWSIQSNNFVNLDNWWQLQFNNCNSSFWGDSSRAPFVATSFRETHILLQAKKRVHIPPKGNPGKSSTQKCDMGSRRVIPGSFQ